MRHDIKDFLICVFSFFFFLINLFIYFGLHWVFIAAWKLSLVAESGGYSSLRCVGFSCWETQALGTQATVVVVHGLSSCGTGAWLLCGMWDLPRPGLKPVSPALAGEFLTTVPPGKSLCSFLGTLLKFWNSVSPFVRWK